MFRPDMSPQPGPGSRIVHLSGETPPVGGKGERERVRTGARDRRSLAPQIELLLGGLLRREPSEPRQHRAERRGPARERKRLAPEGRCPRLRHGRDVARGCKSLPLAPRLFDTGFPVTGRGRRHGADLPQPTGDGRNRPVVATYSAYAGASSGVERNSRSSSRARQSANRRTSANGTQSQTLR